MDISVGILWAAIDLLKLIDRVPGIDQHFPDIFINFSVASPKLTLEFAQRCGWVGLNVNGYLEITDKGRKLLELGHSEIALRLQLADVIETYSPPWARLLPRGRAESFKYLPLDIQQCLKEAGLMNPIDEDIVKWWDNIAQSARKGIAETKLETGRVGERLSLSFERARTNFEPIWQSIESNLCGFDILSIRTPNSSKNLKIEVKTSNSVPSVAYFHISRLEWNIAFISDDFIFHLWALEPEPKLFIVEKGKILNHVPKDTGVGEWENVIIPFNAVIDKS